MHHAHRLLIALVVTALPGPQAALAMPLDGAVFIGDSFTDTGNNAVLFGPTRTAVPLAATNLVPVPPYTSDRYSNGPVWSDRFAARLGHSAVASRLGGTNYAHGGARTGPAGSGLPPSLLDQVSQYLGDTGGAADPDLLYVLAGGGNDARDALAAAASGGDPTAIVTAYPMNIAAMIGSLHSAGAERFLVWNVPEIGAAPAVQAQGPSAAAAATQIAEAMNAGLELALQRLEAQITAEITRFDAFGFIRDLTADPASLGFTDVTTPCAVSAACIASPDTTFFWDGIHPTTAGHAAIARRALASFVPAPGTLFLLFLGAALLCRRWRVV